MHLEQMEKRLKWKRKKKDNIINIFEATVFSEIRLTFGLVICVDTSIVISVFFH